MKFRSRFEEVQAAKVEPGLELAAGGPFVLVVAGAEPVILSSRAFEALFSADAPAPPAPSAPRKANPKGGRRGGRRCGAGSAAEVVRELLLKGGAKTSGEIRAALPKVTAQGIYQALHDLKKRGLAKRDAAGAWSLK